MPISRLKVMTERHCCCGRPETAGNSYEASCKQAIIADSVYLQQQQFETLTIHIVIQNRAASWQSILRNSPHIYPTTIHPPRGTSFIKGKDCQPRLNWPAISIWGNVGPLRSYCTHRSNLITRTYFEWALDLLAASSSSQSGKQGEDRGQ